MQFRQLLVLVGLLCIGCTSNEESKSLIKIGTSEKIFDAWIKDKSLEEFSVELISISAAKQDERRRAVFLRQRNDRHFALVTFKEDEVVKIEDVKDRLSTGLSFRNWHWESVSSLSDKDLPGKH
jgi:hypothetical protein